VSWYTITGANDCTAMADIGNVVVYQTEWHDSTLLSRMESDLRLRPYRCAQAEIDYEEWRAALPRPWPTMWTPRCVPFPVPRARQRSWTVSARVQRRLAREAGMQQ